MENDSLAHAAEALAQGRTEDAVAFLRAAIEDAQAKNDAAALSAAAALARRIPGEEAQEIAAALAAGTTTARRARSWIPTVLLLVALAALAAFQLADRVWAPPTPKEKDFATGEQPIEFFGDSRVLLVPIGRFDASDPDDLAAHLERQYGLNAQVLPALAPRSDDYDPGRKQLDADRLLDLLRVHYLATEHETVVIGLTRFDMFRSSEPDLRFLFAARAESNYAVVSAARMGPTLVDRIRRRDREEERVRKMVERNVAMLLYRLPPRVDPASIMRREIRSVADIDAMYGGIPLRPTP